MNISSVDGLRGANGYAAYSASKWGVRGLTKVAALEFGPRGVRVNSIHPGGILTVMGNPGELSVEDANKTMNKVPLQRLGRVHEVAKASFFWQAMKPHMFAARKSSLTGDGLRVSTMRVYPVSLQMRTMALVMVNTPSART